MRRAYVLCLILNALADSSSAGGPVSTLANLELHSAFWVNLHHTLYGASWARRPQTGARRAVEALPAPLTAPLSDAERAAWEAAVDYYDRNVADRDLRSGYLMTPIKRALAAEDLDAEAVGKELGAILERAAPVYRTHFWPAHDRSNRAWIAETTGRLRTIMREVVVEHERLYGRPWFKSPVRIDVVWVGRAYTSLDPTTHATISPAESALTGWTSVEIVLHEVCHELILPTQRELADALGDRRDEHGALWHVIQFYQTGAVLQQLLSARKLNYTPYMYSTGLFDRAWGRYRKPVEEHWSPHVRGEIARAEAIERTVAAVTAR
jgi:hypothetical protein